MFLFALTLKAQQPVSIHLTEKEGLPDKEFYDILEDDSGLIWLAGDKGLFSYNGKEFTSYTHPEQVGLSVFSLLKDNDNKIWFTNLANQVFYIENEEVNLYVNIKKYFKGSLASLRIHKNYLIVYTIHKLLIYDLNSGKIILNRTIGNDSYFHSTPLIKNDSIFFLNSELKTTIIDKSFNLKSNFINSNKTLDNNQISGFGILQEFKNEYLSSFNTVNGDRLHFKTDLKDKNIYLKTDLPKGVRIYHIEIIEDSLFYGTNQGVYICKLKNNKIQVEQHLLPNIQASKILKDSQGNLWITTLQNGLYVIPNLKLKTNFETNNNAILKTYKGKWNEFFIISKKKEIYRFSSESSKIDTIAFKNSTNNIKYFFYNPLGDNYYIKLLDNNLGLFNLKNNQFFLEKTYSSEIIKDHYFINDNELLLTTNRRIGRATISNQKINFIQNEQIRGYACYYNKVLQQSYFATVDGLFVYDKNFNKNAIKYNGANIYIKDIISNNGKDLWCLSFKNGLYKVVNNRVVAHFNTRNGLLSNTNYFIESDHNSIWIAGEKGIQNLDTKLNTFRNLTQKDGIPSYDFTGLEIIDEIVYISTQKELFSFNSNLVFNNQIKTSFQPYFTSITIDDNKQLLQSNYNLPNDTQKVTISYNTNGFLSSENNRYHYRLFDANEKQVNWQTNTSNNNLINYNRLSEGNYTFQLKAINNQNESEIKEIKFNVAGVFYKQWWFYTTITLGVMTLLFIYFTKQKNRFKEKQNLIIEKQNKELENVFLKLESLRSQMNPHFVFNALNSIQDYIINNQKNLAADYLGKFADLIRAYLEQSTKKEISLSDEIDTLEGYLELEKLRFEEKLEYQIDVDKKLEITEIKIPTILIQPYVENALKHGLLHKKSKGKLTIDFYLSDQDYLIITIKDNGVGRKKASEIKAKQLLQHKSFATKATKNRLELLNYNMKNKIEISTEDVNDKNEDVGTVVTIKIPLE